MSIEDFKLETLQDNPQSDDGAVNGEVMTKRLKQRYPDQNGKFSKDQYEEIDKELNRELASDQVELIKKLSSIETPVYLFGGVAYELLLLEKDGESVSEFARPYNDIDAIIDRKNLAILENKLGELGLKPKEGVEGVQNKEILRYKGSKNGVQLDLDIALMDINPETNEPYINIQFGGKKYKVCFSSDIINDKTIVLGGVKIKTLSPRGLIQSFLFNSQIGFALREKDRIRAKRLCEKYFPGETLDSKLFKVRVEELVSPEKEELMKS